MTTTIAMIAPAITKPLRFEPVDGGIGGGAGE